MLIKSIELSWSRKDPQYYNSWGDIYRSIGEFEKARSLYLQAEKLEPEWNVPKNNLGWLHRIEGNYLEAVKYYTKAGSDDNVAWSYYLSGDLDKAEEFWLKMLENEKNLEDTADYFAVRHRLGMVYWEKGDKEQAKKYFDEQIRLNERDINQNQIPYWGADLAYPRYDLATTKAYLGDVEEAIDLIENKDIFWANPLNMPWWLDHDPLFESIRNDPRFIKVADRVRNKAEAANNVFRQIIQEREASEEMKLRLDR